MLDQATNFTTLGGQPPAKQGRMQRMVGRGAVGLAMRGARPTLTDLHQSGSAKVFLPRVHRDVPELVFLNTAGGVTGGDHLCYDMKISTGVAAMATTQTAERAYRSTGEVGRVDVSISVGEAGTLSWLPQETILFEGSNLGRRTTVELASDARFLMAESVVLGRAAMGETIESLSFSDWREVRRCGAPVWVDPFAISQKVLDGSESAVTLAGARAFATIALIEQGAEDAAERFRSVIESFDGVVAAVSGWNGKCIIRMRATDAWPLRRAVAQVLKIARQGSLPRVWQE